MIYIKEKAEISKNISEMLNSAISLTYPINERFENYGFFTKTKVFFRRLQNGTVFNL